VNHMPPEAFQSDAFDPSMADVWSLGLLLWQIIAKQNPFKVKSKQSFEDQWRVFTESHQFSDDCKQLLDRIFICDANKHIKIDELLEDKHFNNAS
jgi:serine/threonine protein kinase